MPGRAWSALPIAAATLYLALATHAAWLETPTADEFAHLPAGCAYWEHGSFWLYAENPPLLKLWMALPVILDDDVVVPAPPATDDGWAPWRYGVEFMNANRDRYFASFFRARLMVVALGLATAALVFVWGREVFGIRAASVTTSLFLLCPNVLAHSHLATIDAGAMLATTATSFTLRRACRKPERAARWAAAGIVLGSFLAIKFTALALLPVLALFVALEAVAAGRSKGRQLAVRAAAAMLLAVVVTNGVMGFRGTLRPLGSYTFHSPPARAVQEWLPKGTPVPMPATWVTGLDAQTLDVTTGEFGSYLLGEWSANGFWHYDLVALLVKLPEVVLLLAVLAPFAWWRRRRNLLEAAATALPFLAVLFFVTATSRLDIGVRYLLPVFPCLFLSLGPLFEPQPRGRVGDRVIAAFGLTVVLTQAATAAAVHPEHLSYFNRLAGGPAGGAEWLVDSNLDWGQDLYRVREAALRLQGDRPIWLLYFGHVDPALYGLRYRPIPPRPVEGLLFVSVNYWKGLPFPITLPGGVLVPIGADHLAWLRDEQPIERLGSILVFDTRRAPEVRKP